MLYLYSPGQTGARTYNGVQAYEQNVKLIGQVTGRPKAAQEAITRFNRFVGDLKSKAPTNSRKTTVAVLAQSNDGSYSVFGTQSAFCAALAQYSFGRCVGTAAVGPQTISAEQFLKLNPDWIVYVYGDFHGNAKTSWTTRTDPVWKSLAAVHTGHVYNDPAGREFCCGLRTLAPTLQLYAYKVWGPDSGIANPGTNLAAYRYGDGTTPIKPGQ